MGTFRRYPNKPTIIPDQNISLQSCCDSSEFISSETSVPRAEPLDPLLDPPPFGFALASTSPDEDVWSPFSNFSRAVFMAWHYNGGTVKSAVQTDLLAKAITDKRFNASDMLGFSVHKENENIDEFLSQQSTPFQRRHGWHEASVKIRVPCATRTFSSEEDAPEFTVDGIYHRRLVDVIKGFIIVLHSCLR